MVELSELGFAPASGLGFGHLAVFSVGADDPGDFGGVACQVSGNVVPCNTSSKSDVLRHICFSA